jgi:hypothetical protein
MQHCVVTLSLGEWNHMAVCGLLHSQLNGRLRVAARNHVKVLFLAWENTMKVMVSVEL